MGGWPTSGCFHGYYGAKNRYCIEQRAICEARQEKLARQPSKELDEDEIGKRIREAMGDNVQFFSDQSERHTRSYFSPTFERGRQDGGPFRSPQTSSYSSSAQPCLIFEYEANENGCTLLGLKRGRDSEKIQIPKSFNSVPVTQIGVNAFRECANLREVALPSSLEQIGKCAFASCSLLTSIWLPDRLTNIGAYAFAYCESLKIKLFPESLRTIDAGAFSFCKSLTLRPEIGMVRVGSNAFWGCPKPR